MIDSPAKEHSQCQSRAARFSFLPMEVVAKFYRSAEVEQSERQVDQINYLGLELDLMHLLCEEMSSCQNPGNIEATIQSGNPTEVLEFSKFILTGMGR